MAGTRLYIIPPDDSRNEPSWAPAAIVTNMFGNGSSECERKTAVVEEPDGFTFDKL